MAHTDKLEASVLERIAKQIGYLFPKIAGNELSSFKTAELSNTSSIWLLQAQDLYKSDSDLQSIAKNSGSWHSQIRIDSKVVAFADSKPIKDNEKNFSVASIFRGFLV